MRVYIGVPDAAPEPVGFIHPSCADTTTITEIDGMEVSFDVDPFVTPNGPCFDCGEEVADHDHSTCTVTTVYDEYEGGRIKIASRADCDWAGHADAVGEVGYCPVCQH